MNDPDPDSSLDPIEELIARCLAEPDATRARAYQAMVAAHPDLAAELTARVQALRALGIDVFGGAAARSFPERLGDFRLIEPLGGGGMGVVYRAEQLSLHREVALKLIRPEHLYFPGAHERFRRETETIARLQHTGIVPIYTVGETDGIPYFAMERVRGCSLSEVLRALGDRAPESLTAADLAREVARAMDAEAAPLLERALFTGTWVDACLRIALQIADALKHAHERGIVHRDVKPSNIMIAADGRAMLVDFGLTSSSQADRLTRSGAQVGTLAYMSPEQVRGRGDVDATSDVYSLGVTLYEALTLHLPFRTEQRDALTRAILAGEMIAARTHNAKIGADAETVCAKAMDVERARRYASVAAFAEDLGNVLALRPIRARRPGPWGRAVRWVQRHPARAAAITLGVVALVGIPTTLLIQEWRYSSQLKTALDRAKLDAETASAMFEFMDDLFRNADPEEVPAGDVKVREVLDRGAARIDAAFRDRPEARVVLMTRMGECYLSIGAYDRAEPLLLEALDLVRAIEGNGWAMRVFGEDANTEEAWVANVETTLATVYLRTEQYARAEPLLRHALGIMQSARGEQSNSVASVLLSLATAQMNLDQREEAEASLRRGLAILRASPQASPNDLAAAVGNLGWHLHLVNQREEAEGLLREAVALRRKATPEGMPLANALNQLGTFLKVHDRLAEAKPVLEEAVAIHRKASPLLSDRLGKALYNYARLLDALGDRDGALDHYEEAHETLAGVAYDQSQVKRFNAAYYAYAMLCVRRDEEADAIHSELLPHLRKASTPEDHALLRQVLLNQAAVLEHLGHANEARDLRAEVK